LEMHAQTLNEVVLVRLVVVVMIACNAQTPQ